MHEKLTIKPYVIGFALSIILTLAAFFIVNQHVITNHKAFSHEFIIGAILILAFAQLLVQLFFFLHLGREKKPRWNLWVLLSFAGVIVLIIVASLWIMYHLDYNMMPHEMEQKILDDELMELPGYTPDQTPNLP